MEHVFSIKSPVTQMVHFGKLSFSIGANLSGITSTTKMFLCFFFFGFSFGIVNFINKFQYKTFLTNDKCNKKQFYAPSLKNIYFSISP